MKLEIVIINLRLSLKLLTTLFKKFLISVHTIAYLPAQLITKNWRYKKNSLSTAISQCYQEKVSKQRD